MLVDSSVLIDFFRDRDTPQVAIFENALKSGQIEIADLVLTEVMQGFGDEREAAVALTALTAFPLVTLGGLENAVAAAANYRFLRRKGITVRKTIDNLIATWCIRNDVDLLHRDRDFEPFVEHLGLKSAMMFN